MTAWQQLKKIILIIVEVVCVYLIVTVIMAGLGISPFIYMNINMSAFGISILLLILFQVIPWPK